MTNIFNQQETILQTIPYNYSKGVYHTDISKLI